MGTFSDTTLVLMTVALSIASGGCADHRAPNVVGDPQLPNVGWVIMHGHTGNPDEEFGCQSNPRSDCAVHASRPGAQTLSEVHLYLHSTKAETTYSGVARIGFFSGGDTSTGLQIQTLVKPGDVGNYSVVGIVTDRPGEYTFTVDITAVVQGASAHHIRENVTVTVTAQAMRR